MTSSESKRLFQSENGQFEISILNKCVRDMLQECRRSLKETGGVLIGKYNNKLDRAIISEITCPPPDSEKSDGFFQRGIKGLQHIIRYFWESEDRKYYLGEWHFHPNGNLKPSTQDKKQMKKISKENDYHCPESILLIAGLGKGQELPLGVYIFIKDDGYISLDEI